MKIVIVGNRSELAEQIAELADIFDVESFTVDEVPDLKPGGCSPIPDAATALRSPLELVADPTPPAPANTAGPLVLDADQQPWNAEIHSGNQSLKKNGKWTAKRGVDPKRTAEVYAAYTAAASAAAAAAVVAGPTSVIGDAATVAAAATAGTAPDPLAAPVPDPLGAPAGTPPGGALGATPFDGLAPGGASTAADPIAECIRVATAIVATSKDPAVQVTLSTRINNIMGSQGLSGAAELESHPERAPAVLVGLQAFAVEIGLQC